MYLYKSYTKINNKVYNILKKNSVCYFVPVQPGMLGEMVREREKKKDLFHLFRHNQLRDNTFFSGTRQSENRDT